MGKPGETKEQKKKEDALLARKKAFMDSKFKRPGAAPFLASHMPGTMSIRILASRKEKMRDIGVGLGERDGDEGAIGVGMVSSMTNVAPTTPPRSKARLSSNMTPRQDAHKKWRTEFDSGEFAKNESVEEPPKDDALGGLVLKFEK
ncbi:hypothetical protein HK102_008813, partial [Quaeritorhiza haematococci]